MTIANKYAGTCAKCRKRVEEQAGLAIKVDGRWSVYHRDCAPGCAEPQPAATSPADASISLRMVDGRVQVRPNGYLGRDLFDRYLAASGGTEYSRADRCGYASPDMVGAIVTRLAAAGFKLDVDPEVTATVQAWDARARADEQAAAGRAAEIDARLRAQGKALFPFQVQGVNWLAPLNSAILGDDMGLGKTIQALCSLPERAPVLVIGPAVAKGVWSRECARWRPDLRVSVLEGRGSFRWPVAGEVVVTNFDIMADLDVMTAEDRKGVETQLRKLDAALAVKHDGNDAAVAADLRAEIEEDDHRRAIVAACPAGLVVIADEAHAVKGSPKKVARCARFKAIADATYDVAKGRVWLLTATPLLNRPTELWNLLQLIRAHKVVFGSYPKFKQLCGGYSDGYGTKWSAGGIQTDAIAPKLRQVMLRRLKSDVLEDLPAKTVEIIDVHLDAASIKKLDAIKAELEASGIDLDQAIRDAAFGSRQIGESGSIAFELISKMRAVLATAKAAAAMELASEMEEAGEPVVVFSAHRAPVDVLAKRDGWASITGDTAPADRTAIEESFQRGELRGVSGTIKASGVAITLTRAAHAIFVDSEWTPKLNEQAEDRIYRIGQARPVSITYLRAAHELDQRVFAICGVKRQIVARTVDAAAHRDGDLAQRASAAEILAASRASGDGAQRARDAADLADKVRADRAKADAERVRRRSAVKSENANASRGWGIPAEAFDTAPRAAQTPAEEWIVGALASLTMNDGDHAFKENGVGFNKADTFVGQALAASAAAGQLSDGEWIAAGKLLCKYHAQVGRMPGNEEAAS